MDGLLSAYTIETPAGNFVIYPGSDAADPDSHRPLYWYYAPEGWTGKPHSEGFYSSQAAEEACWESLRK
jgi:hypothetical protein